MLNLLHILEIEKNKTKYILNYLVLTLATVFTPRGIMKNLEIIILQQVYQELALPRVNMFIPTVSLYTHCKTKTKQNFADFIKKNFVNSPNFQKSNFVRGRFLKNRSSINLPWGHARSHKKLGPDRYIYLAYRAPSSVFIVNIFSFSSV